MAAQMIDERIRKYPTLSAKLEPYGWFVAPFIVGAEFDRIATFAETLDKRPPADDHARSIVERRIYLELADSAYSNQVRARYVWLALQTPVLREYSHLYEFAVFSYYKREYPAAITLLLIALEGIVRTLRGWNLGQQNPSFQQLRDTVANIPPANFNAELNAVQEMYREAFSHFVNDWIYIKTDDADFSLSVLNRHYVLHGLEPRNFYRPLDVHRLLLAFDLLIDVVSMSKGIYYATVPDEATQYSERSDYYAQLRAGQVLVRNAAERELKLLSEHPNYVVPADEPFRLYFP